jgi:hypothetical protein
VGLHQRGILIQGGYLLGIAPALFFLAEFYLTLDRLGKTSYLIEVFGQIQVSG